MTALGRNLPIRRVVDLLSTWRAGDEATAQERGRLMAISIGLIIARFALHKARNAVVKNFSWEKGAAP